MSTKMPEDKAILNAWYPLIVGASTIFIYIVAFVINHYCRIPGIENLYIGAFLLSAGMLCGMLVGTLSMFLTYKKVFFQTLIILLAYFFVVFVLKQFVPDWQMHLANIKHHNNVLLGIYMAASFLLGLFPAFLMARSIKKQTEPSESNNLLG